MCIKNANTKWSDVHLCNLNKIVLNCWVDREGEFRSTRVYQLPHLVTSLSTSPPKRLKRNENLIEYRENDDWKQNIACEVERRENREMNKSLKLFASRELKNSKKPRRRTKQRKITKKSMTYSHRYVTNVFDLLLLSLFCCFSSFDFSLHLHMDWNRI